MDTLSENKKNLYAPRHWPVWIGLGLLRLCTRLPYTLQLGIGRRIGDCIYLTATRRRKIARINIELCFPQLDARARQDLLRKTFQSVGISLIESALSWWSRDKKLRGLFRIEGEDYLHEALQGGKGVLLLGGHYTTLEISGRLLGLCVKDIQPIYKPAHNPVFNAVMQTARRRLFDGLLLNTDFRSILRSLQDNKIVWYAPDQDFGRKQTVFAPFMNLPAATLTVTAKLARASGAPVLPFYSQRLPDGQGYLLRILPPLADFPSGDDVTDATRINQVIETQVRAAPVQYLWLHRRFKTRPEGEPKIYPKRNRRHKKR